ncbi:MAG: NADPH-dependent 7-cyano-7-deazaguanine reductase QueF [Nitrospiraceae bacterium]|jgi:7-cyano-7-deazaguanine reductase|nr:NADPH-dependent 7-cyano-7-deazaguanine reductase QueF [Nitrospiraceae bacterium]|tara:strand:+ start:279 stop:680 length:402 start_codon:yes stop_codon:yes gene_type:complete
MDATGVTTYTDKHAESGIASPLPTIDTWPNQFSAYEIAISIPEYTSICPRTGLPDFGTLTITYIPDRLCLELKSLKAYIHSYRNLGIFYENAVNRVLKDVVAACNPSQATVVGEFTVRGGMRSVITASHPAPQ